MYCSQTMKGANLIYYLYLPRKVCIIMYYYMCYVEGSIIIAPCSLKEVSSVGRIFLLLYLQVIVIYIFSFSSCRAIVILVFRQ